MDNYEFCTRFVLQMQKRFAYTISILDYGCGPGDVVRRLRKQNVGAFGCDSFYEGGDASRLVPAEMMGGVIRRMDDGRIPFSSESFDLVISNQVMEHVENLDWALHEIHRILKPGGMLLSLFPDRSVWREGHCGIPFLHWFPKGSRIRICYAAGLRAVGLGHYKEGKGIGQWSVDFCDWLDKWTYYRSYREIRRTFCKYFGQIQHIEDLWLEQRLEDRAFLVSWFPRAVKRLIVRKLAGLVFTCVKSEATSTRTLPHDVSGRH